MLAGAVSLVAQPVAGAQQNGVGGFFTGLATGVASAIALPVTGVAVGAYQIARGVGKSFNFYWVVTFLDVCLLFI